MRNRKACITSNFSLSSRGLCVPCKRMVRGHVSRVCPELSGVPELFCQDSAPNPPDDDALKTCLLCDDMISPPRALRSRAHAPCVAQSRHTGRGARARRAPLLTQPRFSPPCLVCLLRPPNVGYAARSLVERAVWPCAQASRRRVASDSIGVVRWCSHVQHRSVSMTLLWETPHNALNDGFHARPPKSRPCLSDLRTVLTETYCKLTARA